MKHWCTIAPIILDWKGPSFHPFEAVHVGCGVHLIRAPQWLRGDAITQHMSLIERQCIESARFALAIDYEAESDGDPDRAWLRQPGMSKQAVAAEKIRLVNLTLWLARPSWLAFRILIDAREDNGNWILRHAYSSDPIRPHARDAENALTIADLDLGKALAENALELPIRSAPWRALLLLWRGLQEVDGHNRYLFLWIGLEALFGPVNAAEITYRLSQRLALFLSESRPTARELYGRAKTAYSMRSKVVHGLQVADLGREKSDALLVDSELWIRAALQKVISDAKLRHLFENERRREAFLDDLAFTDA